MWEKKNVLQNHALHCAENDKIQSQTDSIIDNEVIQANSIRAHACGRFLACKCKLWSHFRGQDTQLTIAMNMIIFRLIRLGDYIVETDLINNLRSYLNYRFEIQFPECGISIEWAVS